MNFRIIYIDSFKAMKWLRFPRERGHEKAQRTLRMPKIRDWAREDPAKVSKREWSVEQDKDQESVAPWNLKKGVRRIEWLCQILLKVWITWPQRSDYWRWQYGCHWWLGQEWSQRGGNLRDCLEWVWEMMWGEKEESEHIRNSFKMCCCKGEERPVTVDGVVRECLYSDTRMM